VRDVLHARDDDRLKIFVIRQALQARRRHAALFARGEYRPLQGEGPSAERLVAFSRRLDGRDAIVLAGRFLALLGDRVESGMAWAGTSIAGVLPGRYRNVFTGAEFDADDRLKPSEILRPLPIALLEPITP